MAKKLSTLSAALRQAEGGDALRDLLKAAVEEVMSCEADAMCGADYGERSDERTNSRNGYRSRPWDTRMGTINLEVPKLRKGTYQPEWAFEPRRRAERGLMAVVTEAYVCGVSTRKVDSLVQALGIEGISKSQVSELAKNLDEHVKSFLERRLDAGPYRYVWLDAIFIKCRDGGRIANVAAIIATGVNANGQREILGLDVITTEDGPGWLAFLRSLVTRGLNGVEFVVSDCHEGLRGAIEAALPGATWQRCRTHYMRNLLTRVPKTAHDVVAALVRSIWAQPDKDAVLAQHARVVEQLTKLKLKDAAVHLESARDDVLAFVDAPKEHWRKIWSNNPQERLNKELRRRTDVVGIFPNRAAIVRLLGAVLCEQNDEWTVAKRYMSPEALKLASALPIDDGQPQALPAAA